MTSRCPCCFSNRFDVHVGQPRDREYFVVRKSPARFNRCLNCDSIFQHPWPSAGETAGFYHADYQNYEASKAPLIAALSQWLQKRTAESFLRRTSKDAAILDFGCNQGAFLRSLKRTGCNDLTGFDVVPLKTQAEGFTFYSDLEALTSSSKRYDVIRMNHVVEHLAELETNMKVVASLLKPGGRVMGQTPNAIHFTARLLKSYWGPLHYPYHLALFSPSGLNAAAKRWGLQFQGTFPTIMPTGWAMSLENWMKPKTFSKLRGRSPLYVLYLAITAPIVILDRIFSGKSQTAIIDFELVKE